MLFQFLYQFLRLKFILLSAIHSLRIHCKEGSYDVFHCYTLSPQNSSRHIETQQKCLFNSLKEGTQQYQPHSKSVNKSEMMLNDLKWTAVCVPKLQVGDFYFGERINQPVVNRHWFSDYRALFIQSNQVWMVIVIIGSIKIFLCQNFNLMKKKSNHRLCEQKEPKYPCDYFFLFCATQETTQVFRQELSIVAFWVIVHNAKRTVQTWREY